MRKDRWGCGCAIADYDNDGWPDIYVTNFGKNRPYHNNRHGTFAERVGVELGNWSTGATFGDYDGDGRLDLFVAGYVHWNLQHPPELIQHAVRSRACNGLLLKVDQVGTLTEAALAFRRARQARWRITVGVRSGETEDNWAADLAVGWGRSI